MGALLGNVDAAGLELTFLAHLERPPYVKDMLMVVPDRAVAAQEDFNFMFLRMMLCQDLLAQNSDVFLRNGKIEIWRVNRNVHR